MGVSVPATVAPRRLVHALLFAGAVAACLLALAFGAVDLTPAQVLAALLDPESPDAAIIRELRVPRIALGFGVGGALAVAGAALQAVVGNPLAEPWLLGISGGAGLGAVLAVVIGLPPGWSVAACATLGALAAIALVYRVSLVAGRRVDPRVLILDEPASGLDPRAAGRRVDPRVLILAGVVVGAFASAVSAAILAVTDPFTFRAAALWLFGGFAGASWSAVGRFALAAVPALLVLGWLARGLDLLALGDDTALALGADASRVRRLAIVATAVLTAASVSVAGVIGFVGLAVPHGLRWTGGPRQRGVVPAAFIAGGAFAVLADAGARTVLAPAELPVGVITALVGVPIFAMLLRRSAS